MINKIIGKIKRSVKTVIYGSEGIGKSTLASQVPDPLFIDLEGGTAQLDIARVEPPTSWEKLIALINEVAATPGICKTLVIDTVDWAEQMCITHICHKYNQPNLESFGYGKGYVILQEEFKLLLDALDQVIAAGINVILLAHAYMRKQELPDEAGAFDRWELKLTKKVAPMIKEYADALLFANYKTYVVSTGSNAKKAHGGKRVIYTSHHPCWDAKNRFGLPEEVDMSYDSIAQLFSDTSESVGKQPNDKIKELLDEAGVTAEEVEQVVNDNLPDQAGKLINEYDDTFINDTLLPNWKNVVDAVHQYRNSTINKADEAFIKDKGGK